MSLLAMFCHLTRLLILGKKIFLISEHSWVWNHESKIMDLFSMSLSTILLSSLLSSIFSPPISKLLKCVLWNNNRSYRTVTSSPIPNKNIAWSDDLYKFSIKIFLYYINYRKSRYYKVLWNSLKMKMQHVFDHRPPWWAFKDSAPLLTDPWCESLMCLVLPLPSPSPEQFVPCVSLQNSAETPKDPCRNAENQSWSLSERSQILELIL